MAYQWGAFIEAKKKDGWKELCIFIWRKTFLTSMRNLILTFTILLLLSCNHGKKSSLHSSLPDSLSSPFIKNIIEVKQYGDSISVEVEKRGDTLIKHYKDLKGLSGDNFDNSYDAECVYRKIRNSQELKCDFSLKESDYLICFSKKQIVQYCDSMILACEKSEEIQANLSAEVYKEYKGITLKKTNKINFYMLPDLLVNVDFKIINTKTKELPVAILVEYYKTSFSGGKNFSVITSRNDTISFIHSNEYMN